MRFRCLFLFWIRLQTDGAVGGNSGLAISHVSAAFLIDSSLVTGLLPDKLEAVLVSDQGYHQVGPPDRCTDMFVLSVTLAFASRLEQVTEPE